MAPQARSGRASRCILRDRRSVVAGPHCCRRSGTRHAQFLPRSAPGQLGRQHPPPHRRDKMLLAARLARAVKPDTSQNRCNRHQQESATGEFQEEEDQGNVQSKKEHCNDSEKDLDCGEEAVKEEHDEDMMDDDLDEETLARLERLQNYACPKLRRKALLGWVNQRIQEISHDDADEPDSEDHDIRSALMDAVGVASVNVEADLRDSNVDSLTTISKVPPKSAGTSPRSRICFADSSITYVLKLDTGDTVTCGSAAGPSWSLDEIVETNVFDSPSAPLRKW